VDSEPAVATITSPIIGGTIDTGDPGVVAVTTSDALTVCTGTMISSRVVLTAAHCLTRWRSNPLEVAFGAKADAPDSTIAIIDAIRHPDFALSPMVYRDVGMALLAAPSTAPVLPLWRTPLDASAVGKQIRLVGYGAVDTTSAPDLTKRQGTSVINTYDADTIDFSAMPNTPCFGDSGGPNFMTDSVGTERIVAVTSHGDEACTQAASTRIDVQADPFVDPYLAVVEPGAAAPGDRCYYDGNCASGTCSAATDAPSLSYCSDPCTATSDCRPGMECTAQMCRWPLPTPGAEGTACEVDHECESDLCGSPALGRPARCALRCAKGDPDLACPSGLTCVDDVRSSEQMCVPTSGGCGCGATGQADGLVVAGVAGALFRRRRRAPAPAPR
jgi:MYXO-CTERM domain-containing protein